jgi:AcrR family transcriptional regulator
MDRPGDLQLPADPRGRLLGGLALAIVEKGYAATTIADVVRHARVSKRTFYEHFADKEACYLALYAAVNDHLLEVIQQAVHGAGPWRSRVEAAARAYLSELAAQPALTRTFLVEIQAAGPRALAARRAMHERFAEHLRGLSAQAATDEPGVTPLSPTLATAVAGGINELMLQAVEDERTPELADLTGVATELIVAVVSARVVTA